MTQIDLEKFDQATLILSQVRAQLACFSVFLTNEDHMCPTPQLMGEALGGMETGVQRALELLT